MNATPLAQALERLVIVTRETPRAAEVHGAMAATAARAAAALGRAERIEAGVEGSAIAEGTTLQGRMLARAVDWIEIGADATADGLLSLAHALASEDEPMPLVRGITVTLVPVPLPPEPATIVLADMRVPASGGPASGRRVDDDEPRDAELERLMDRVSDAAEAGTWAEVIARGKDLLDYARREPGGGRSRIIRARRVLARPVLEAIVEHALRHPEAQLAAADLLAGVGPEGHEVMVVEVAASESFATRRFLHDQLGRIPEAVPLLLPLLTRGSSIQARHAAAILGRIGDPRVIAPLAAALDYGDEATRAEILRALVRFDDPAARSAVMQGLKHASAATRIAAAQAVGNAGLLALSPSVMAVLREETDSSVRRAFATAAARLGTVEATEELVRMALARKRLLGGGFPLETRLDVVAGFAAAGTPAARRCLDRIAREGDRPVQAAADQALSIRRQ